MELDHAQAQPHWWLQYFKHSAYLPPSPNLYLVPAFMWAFHALIQWAYLRLCPAIFANEWIQYFLTKKTNVTEFSVSTRGVSSNGHLVEVKCNRHQVSLIRNSSSSLQLTILTRDTKLLPELVKEAHDQFLEANKPYVAVHSVDVTSYIPANPWTTIVHKVPRPLSSVILPDGMTKKLVGDVQEFLHSEDSYVQMGIPYRRGYLLSGPPGTGKSAELRIVFSFFVEYSPATVQRRPYSLSQANSTCFLLEADCVFFRVVLHSYSLKHSLNSMDDSVMQRAVSNIPRHSILLIEDIDCFFGNRENDEDGPVDAFTVSRPGSIRGNRDGELRCSITLSGFLNMIDGVASEEGRLFFATCTPQTNHYDRLDLALSRPGRVDVHFQYELSTADQAKTLFMRFFQEFKGSSVPASSAQSTQQSSQESTAALADSFAKAIPATELSIAEIQAYLQLNNTSPHEAACGAGAWVERVCADRRAWAEREAERKR
ncbi:P-loop containing nucleoside triphosphate hydrolase protein [Mycena metata]|uniref:P-loop containing nucleoside triphosphate hydrolase protein n=1 Tax=Mycena metata TaxID=1033252 RepID=A0AAD7I574_9AGAR|nr:P-loop containing nucleoside triphosphate hydrolase protein [Mycena metata]